MRDSIPNAELTAVAARVVLGAIEADDLAAWRGAR